MCKNDAPNFRYVPTYNVCANCRNVVYQIACTKHPKVNLDCAAGSMAEFHVCDDFEEWVGRKKMTIRDYFSEIDELNGGKKMKKVKSEKYMGSLVGSTMNIDIKPDSINITDASKTLTMFSTDEGSLVIQITSNEKDDRGHSKECMTFYLPESIRPIVEAAIVRGI